MRCRHFRKLALAAIFMSLEGASVGQNTTLISLDQAIDLALAHNHALQATRTTDSAEPGAGDHRESASQSDFWGRHPVRPVFQPAGFFRRQSEQRQQFDVGIGYLFERGHKRQRRLQAARDQTAVTRAQVADAERTLAFNVGQQFVSVLLAESTLQLALQDLQGFQQDGRHQRDTAQSGIHRRRRLSEDQTAVTAISDRRVFREAGESAGPGWTARISRLQRGAREFRRDGRFSLPAAQGKPGRFADAGDARAP